MLHEPDFCNVIERCMSIGAVFSIPFFIPTRVSGNWKINVNNNFVSSSPDQRSCQPRNGHSEPNAPVRTAHQDTSATSTTGRKAVREGGHPEDADQEAEETEFGESQVRASATVDGQGDGRLCAGRRS